MEIGRPVVSMWKAIQSLNGAAKTEPAKAIAKAKKSKAPANGGERADLVFTDPPYNVDYEGYPEEMLKIQSDRMTRDAFKAFLGETFRSYWHVVKAGASLYVCHPSSWQREFRTV
jgi:DNA modification methylase